MFENFIARAYNNGTEFVTMDDLQKRIRAFDAAQLTVNQVGNSITAQVSNATNIGNFALKIDAGTQVIQNVTNYYAYDSDSVFTTKIGGNYTINLGTTADDVSHITALDQRNELISVTGDGTNLSFNFNGSGKVMTDMKAITTAQRYQISGADSVSITGDKIALTFNANANHTASISVVNNSAPIVQNPLSNLVINNDAAAPQVIDLTNIFSDINGDVIVKSLVGNTNTNLLTPTINGNSLTLQYQPYEFGSSTITIRASDGTKTVDTSFNVTVNPVSTVINGTASAQTLNGGASNEIIKGLAGNDILNGNNGNDVLIGGTGNDKLYGGNGNDILIGVDPTSTIAGRGEYDILQGDAGADRYILGDSRQVYYNDGNNTNTGRSDYADIVGFSATQGDVIQLKGKAC